MSEIFDSIEISDDVKRFVDHSFDISNQIYSILNKQGKTQKDLATLLGKKESEISKWMQGTHNFTIKSISKIESVLEERILITPIKMPEVYSNIKLVPVNIYAHKNNFDYKEGSQKESSWKSYNDNGIFKEGLKVA